MYIYKSVVCLGFETVEAISFCTRFTVNLYYFIFHCKRVGIPLSNTFLYLKQNVLYWPDDDRLRTKHVATV
jgi:hypothetical protein